MSTIATAKFVRIGEYMGGGLSLLKRYREAANLIGSTSYFLFIKRDEFGFVPDTVAAFDELKNLLRRVAYDAADDILRLEITDGNPTPGTSFSLKIVFAFSGTVVATASGDYGVKVNLISSIDLGPTGKVLITAPSGTPGADQQVEIQVVPSGVRLVNDVTGETEDEQLVESSALENSLVTAQNLRIPLLESARDVVFTERFLQGLLGPFLGSSTLTVFDQNVTTDDLGNVLASPSGLLPEFDQLMKINIPVQTVQRSVVVDGTPAFSSDIDVLAFGSIVFATDEPSNGTFEAKCTSGFTGGRQDPEEFTLSFKSTDFERTIEGPGVLRPFRSFNWPEAGFNITELVRKTEVINTTHATLPKYTNVNPASVPSGRVTIITSVTNSRFLIREATTGRFLFNGGNTTDVGVLNFRLFDGSDLQFTWDGFTGNEVFEIFIRPFHVGDLLTILETSDGAGRLNLELRRIFDFAFTQNGVSPTIPNDVVSADLPFVAAILGT